jgi:hypothetical protein
MSTCTAAPPSCPSCPRGLRRRERLAGQWNGVAVEVQLSEVVARLTPPLAGQWNGVAVEVQLSEVVARLTPPLAGQWNGVCG